MSSAICSVTCVNRAASRPVSTAPTSAVAIDAGSRCGLAPRRRPRTPALVRFDERAFVRATGASRPPPEAARDVGGRDLDPLTLWRILPDREGTARERRTDQFRTVA